MRCSIQDHLTEFFPRSGSKRTAETWKIKASLSPDKHKGADISLTGDHKRTVILNKNPITIKQKSGASGNIWLHLDGLNTPRTRRGAVEPTDEQQSLLQCGTQPRAH